MPTKKCDSAAFDKAAATKAANIEVQRKEALLKTGALQNAIFNSADFSIIATDEKGIIQLFNIGAERSVFWIELVAAAAPQLAVSAAEPAVPAQTPAGNDAPPRTLLYIEDNPANLQLIEQLIARRPDIHLLSARNGPLGIEIARASRPDVILMDINLPGMSGIKAMQILRADTATARIPVVALSANAMPRDIARGLEAGFFRYLTKPIKVNEFMDTLDVALEFAEQEVSQSR